MRETPSSSKESVNDREYYRKEFDPTYHPLIYDLMKNLVKQAEEFQIAVDPVYDRFLKDIHCVSKQDHQRQASCFDLGHCDIAGLLKQKGGRFAALAILTAGNYITSGFSNITHADYDFLPSEFLYQCLLTIQQYYNVIKKMDSVQMYQHLITLVIDIDIRRNSQFTQHVDTKYSQVMMMV